MIKRLASKIGAAVLAASMMMSMAAPAMAATTYTPVAGTSTTFNKYLIMDNGDSVPNATFSFTVAPGTAIPAAAESWSYDGTPYESQALAEAAAAADGGSASDVVHNDATMAVLAGLGTPTIADITFAPSDTSSATSTTTGLIDIQRDNEDRGGTAGDDAVQLDSGEKFVTKTATVSFSGITFPEPGVYRYIISETADAAHASAGITHDTDSDRVLDVYVTDDGTGTLVVSSYVLHTDVNGVAPTANGGSGDVSNAGDAVADKTDGFTNEVSGYKDLAVKKEVSGNQASRDKYFKLTVTVPSLAATDTFVVSLADDSDAATPVDGSADAAPSQNAATKYSTMSNPSSVTGSQLGSGVDFYLQHGQSVVIRGLPLDATYSVVEDAEDYVSTAADGTAGVTGYTDKVATGSGETLADIVSSASDKTIQTSYINTRNGVIPTGVMMAVAPFAIATLIGGAGVATMSMKKRKKEEDE